MVNMRVADYVMARLSAFGIKHLFMVTGRGILYLSDAAAKHAEIECVSVHHEQAGAYAAMAYAQCTEKAGACLVSTGCASANAITPTLCAWQDEIPLVIISGQNTLRETTRHTGLPIRTYGQQEFDIIGLVTPITKYAVMIEDPDSIAFELDKALHLAVQSRKGPVWIDIPLDIQNMRVEPLELVRFVPEILKLPLCNADIEYVKRALYRAVRPVLFIGSGVRSSGSLDMFRAFAKRFDFPVVYASSAVDSFGADYDLSMGVVSTMAGNRAANFAVQNADLILVIGCRLTSMTVGGSPEKFGREAQIIVVDIDEFEHKKGTVNIDKFIHADAADFLASLTAEQGFAISDAWKAKCLHWKSVFPKCEESRKHSQLVDLHYLAEKLGVHLQNDAILICDSGLEELIMPNTVSYKRSQRCLHPASQGAMGYALPAAIGAWLSTGRQVVAIIGDGSIMMNIQELQTIAHHKYPIKILIINNDCYAVIRNRQRDLFRSRTIGTDASNGISCPEFEKVSACFDIEFAKINDANELDEKLFTILAAEGPIICEILSPPDQNFLHSSFTRSKEKKFVQRPLEDQSPFLDRSIFLSEMIIEPIDQ